MDLIPLACIIINLGHLLIDPSLGGAMAIVYGDREAIAVDDRDGVRQCADGTEPLPLRVPQDPLRQTMSRTVVVVDRVPFPMGRK